MMSRYFWKMLAVVVWLGATWTQAQGNPSLSPVIPITEKKLASVPKSIAASADWKLLRSCVAPVGEKGKKVWVLALGRKESIPPNSLLDDLLNIMLVVAEPPTINSQTRWRVLRRVPLGLRPSSVGHDFELRWLKPAEKSGPVLVVPQSELTRHEILAFPEGWQQSSAVREKFHNGHNPIQGFAYSFDTLDEHNILAVALNITNYSDGHSSSGGTELLRWNGNGWGQQSEGN